MLLDSKLFSSKLNQVIEDLANKIAIEDNPASVNNADHRDNFHDAAAPDYVADFEFDGVEFMSSENMIDHDRAQIIHTMTPDHLDDLKEMISRYQAYEFGFYACSEMIKQIENPDSHIYEILAECAHEIQQQDVRIEALTIAMQMESNNRFFVSYCAIEIINLAKQDVAESDKQHKAVLLALRALHEADELRLDSVSYAFHNILMRHDEHDEALNVLLDNTAVKMTHGRNTMFALWFEETGNLDAAKTYMELAIEDASKEVPKGCNQADWDMHVSKLRFILARINIKAENDYIEPESFDL